MQGVCEQLLGQKSDRLFEFLQLTKKMTLLFEKQRETNDCVQEWTMSEAFISELEQLINKRAELSCKIDGIDVLISNEISKGHKFSSKEEKKRRLCKKLLEDIEEEQASQGDIMTEMFKGSMEKIKNVNGLIKGYRAYNFLDARTSHSKEWKK